MGDSLGGALQLLFKWGRQAFVTSALGFVVFGHLQTWTPTLEKPTIVLMCASVATFPLAAVTVWRDSDRASRRNWMILILLCLLMIAAASIWHVPL